MTRACSGHVDAVTLASRYRDDVQVRHGAGGKPDRRQYLIVDDDRGDFGFEGLCRALDGALDGGVLVGV